jgi:ubiquinone biosynthesis protein
LRRDLQPATTPAPASLPRHFRQALEEVGPTFVKLGQMLSTRPDLLPPDYINELAKLQDEVPPVAWHEIRQVIQAELQAPPEEIFAMIDSTPIAAASLGQVHLARLPSREKVVVKIQRPNILATIQTDLEIIQDIARYLEQHTPLGRIYRLEEMAEDFSDMLNNELNYQREGQNADRFRHNFAEEEYLYIPRVHWEYSTRRVLVLEHITGIKIDNILALDEAGYDRHKIATRAAKFIIKEVLEDGFFHADPHPGNLIIMDNEVIGVMDFGMVGHLSDQDRMNLIRLYAVAVRMDVQGVVDELIHIGAAPQTVDRRALTRDVERLLNYYYGLPLKEIRATEVINEVMPIAFKHHLRLPTNLWLLGKTLAMIEGLGLKLDPEFDIFAFSAPRVGRLLVKNLLPNRRTAENLLRRWLTWNDLLDDIPHISSIMLQRIEEGTPIKLTLDHVCWQRIDVMVTRMALSIIIAGMIIGLAFVLPTAMESVWVVQAIVLIGFIASLALGGWVLISIVRRK